MVISRPSPGRLSGVLAAVVFVAALGELRVPDARAVSGPAGEVGARSPVSASADLAANLVGLGADVDGSSAGSEDDARLVPAVYARDPDMRFVFYRQVSKWM